MVKLTVEWFEDNFERGLDGCMTGLHSCNDVTVDFDSKTLSTIATYCYACHIYILFVHFYSHRIRQNDGHQVTAVIATDTTFAVSA